MARSLSTRRSQLTNLALKFTRMSDNWFKFISEIILIPIQFLTSFAFAWIPMLGWNHGIHTMWPDTPVIGYWTAFWFCVFTNYLVTRVVVFKK